MDDFMFGPGEKIFFVVFGAVFLTILRAFVVTIVKGIAQWSRDNASPVTTVTATVLTKRGHVSTTSGHTASGHTASGDTMAGIATSGHSTSSTSTSYFVTFELEDGDRKEFAVLGNAYGVVIEGDRGRLTYQGTRFKGFDRLREER